MPLKNKINSYDRILVSQFLIFWDTEEWIDSAEEAFNVFLRWLNELNFKNEEEKKESQQALHKLVE